MSEEGFRGRPQASGLLMAMRKAKVIGLRLSASMTGL